MLSDEEKKAMQYFYNLRATIDESNMLFDEDIDVKCGKETIKQITIILNLIEKQSKEIEKLNYIKRSFDYCVEQEIEKLNKSDTSKEQSSMYYYNLYEKLVDKIKAKIEEIKKSKENIYFEEHLESILQSLLEKE